MFRALILAAFVLLFLAACNKSWAPVEDRSSSRAGYEMTSDGTYTVRRGDSLHAIAFNFGLDWRQIARWNNISAPYVIYPDQVLRLSAEPPRAAVTTTGTGSRPKVQERSVETTAKPPPSQPPSQQTARTTPPPASKPAPAKTTTSPSPSSSKQVSTADPSRWIWPTPGRILSNFKAGDPARNGIEIAGEEGQAIVASAAGEVVYSGSGLIGYGELIIVKHSDRMLSAYAHNRKRLVAEGQAVSSGEKIAEMGRDERNRAMLHFEIRRDGNPQDPRKYLPKK